MLLKLLHVFAYLTNLLINGTFQDAFFILTIFSKQIHKNLKYLII